ncbi:MAG: HAMP domain-containing protein [Anaerolineales bacterium]|nr:HAMP domain-containing protein [Anaerolineales bacterium]
MFTSLRSRLFLGFIAIIAVVLATSAFALLVFVARNNLGARIEIRNTAARMIQRPELNLGDLRDFSSLVTRLDENTGYRILVLGPTGKVIADSQEGVQPALPLITRVPADPLRDVFTLRDVEGNFWLYTGRRFESGFALILLAPRQPLRELLKAPVSLELLKALAQSGAVSLVLAAGLVLILSRSVSAPLKQISEAALSLADGKNIQVKPEGPKEVRVLGEVFNQMSQTVHASQQSQRDFVANVSHELKTPLTSVQGFAQAILDGTAESPEAKRQAAQVIYDEAGRMHRLVIDLLDLARLDSGTADMQRERVSLSILLRAVIERLTPQSVLAGVSLVDQVPDLPDVIGDGDRLSQVFNNLVDNAIKYTPAGGEVTLSALVSDGNVIVNVRDSGSGIPAEELSRIFERFYQMDKSRQKAGSQGVGLGLAIARQIIAAHGGKIEAASTMGEGSIFRVILPIAKPDDITLSMRKAG